MINLNFSPATTDNHITHRISTPSGEFQFRVRLRDRKPARTSCSEAVNYWRESKIKGGGRGSSA